jgi:hypothetical protein
MAIRFKCGGCDAENDLPDSAAKLVLLYDSSASQYWVVECQFCKRERRLASPKGDERTDKESG